MATHKGEESTLYASVNGEWVEIGHCEIVDPFIAGDSFENVAREIISEYTGGDGMIVGVAKPPTKMEDLFERTYYNWLAMRFPYLSWN